MKRNIVRHGPSTLTISLPAKWVKENNIKPGDNVEIEEKGKQLIVYTKKHDQLSSLNIDIGNNYRTGLRYINSSYRKGCDELIIYYDDPGYLKRIEQSLSEDVLGFEIIKQGKSEGKNFCVIRDIPGVKFDEFDTLLERIWIILISISEDILKAIEEKDNKSIGGFLALDKRIYKFSNFCIRVLNKRSHPNYKNIPIYYRFFRGLEELSDHYKNLGIISLENNIAVSKEFIEIIKQLNECLRLFYKTYYKYSDKNIEILFEKTEEINLIIREHAKKKKDAELNSYLYNINDKMKNLFSSLIEMNILN